MIVCHYCRIEFTADSSAKRKYCSRKCQYKGIDYKRGKESPNYRQIKKICLFCNKVYYLSPSVAIRSKYCSWKCKGIARSKVRGKEHPLFKEKIELQCKICDKKFKIKPSHHKRGNAKYCSRACQSQSLKERTGKDNPLFTSVEILCANCRKKVFMQPNQIRQKNYCSEKCRVTHMKKENHSCWMGGISFEPYSPDFDDKLKQQIRERDGYKCQTCGEYGHPVHHIDYDKQNSVPDNLITLCVPCHTKTNHNREYWQFHFESQISGDNQLSLLPC